MISPEESRLFSVLGQKRKHAESISIAFGWWNKKRLRFNMIAKRVEYWDSGDKNDSNRKCINSDVSLRSSLGNREDYDPSEL